MLAQNANLKTENINLKKQFEVLTHTHNELKEQWEYMKERLFTESEQRTQLEHKYSELTRSSKDFTTRISMLENQLESKAQDLRSLTESHSLQIKSYRTQWDSEQKSSMHTLEGQINGYKLKIQMLEEELVKMNHKHSEECKSIQDSYQFQLNQKTGMEDGVRRGYEEKIHSLEQTITSLHLKLK
jgi:chromosome segregation ATPase